MLVLSRKVSEVIRIGEGPQAIEIQVMRIGPNTVRLGITAPGNVPIVRTELLKSVSEASKSVPLNV